jgi:hypothetical protein
MFSEFSQIGAMVGCMTEKPVGTASTKSNKIDRSENVIIDETVKSHKTNSISYENQNFKGPFDQHRVQIIIS